MPKNIVIFSDGTGQAGGINFDEVRTNVYKLYRACRVGPDTRIGLAEQVAFYDPGLGSTADGGHLDFGWMHKIYNLLSMATGLGITADIIDCYAAIIRLYERSIDRSTSRAHSSASCRRRNVLATYCRLHRTWTRQLPESSFVKVAIACALSSDFVCTMCAPRDQMRYKRVQFWLVWSAHRMYVPLLVL
jgi:hypothetical protein